MQGASHVTLCLAAQSEILVSEPEVSKNGQEAWAAEGRCQAQTVRHTVEPPSPPQSGGRMASLSPVPTSRDGAPA